MTEPPRRPLPNEAPYRTHPHPHPDLPNVTVVETDDIIPPDAETDEDRALAKVREFVATFPEVYKAVAYLSPRSVVGSHVSMPGRLIHCIEATKALYDCEYWLSRIAPTIPK